MKLGATHISFIGVAISAVVAVVAILYYRNASANAAAQAGDGQSSGSPVPFFQTAALPSSLADNGNSNTPAATAPAIDLTGLTTAITKVQAQQTNASLTNSLASNFTDILSSFTGKDFGGQITGAVNTGGVETDFTFGNFSGQWSPFFSIPGGPTLVNPTIAPGGSWQANNPHNSGNPSYVVTHGSDTTGTIISSTSQQQPGYPAAIVPTTSPLQ